MLLLARCMLLADQPLASPVIDLHHVLLTRVFCRTLYSLSFFVDDSNFHASSSQEHKNAIIFYSLVQLVQFLLSLSSGGPFPTTFRCMHVFCTVKVDVCFNLLLNFGLNKMRFFIKKVVCNVPCDRGLLSFIS